jgi:hypothetical protein
VIEKFFFSPTPEEMRQNPMHDCAEHILRLELASDEVRANAWEAFHQSQTPEELVTNLRPIPISDETKRALLLAKQITQPPPTPVDKVVSALGAMAKMNPHVLAAAESHPTVAKALIDAATKE